MAYEHKVGTFMLFKNDKGGVDTRPDYRGEGKDLQGKSIEVAAWLKDGKKGKYMSCSIKPASVRNTPDKEPGKKVASGFDDISDDIPF